MTDFESEKLIRRLFAALSRKSLPDFGKEQVWQRIQNHIRSAKRQTEREKSLPIWSYLALPRTLVRVGVTILVVVIALSLAGGVAYAQPGQTLYPVKIAAEQVELVLATNDTAKVKVGIKHAKRRLQEVQTLVQENKDSEIVEQTLQALKSATDEVVNVAVSAGAKPELASQATELAVEQESVLTDVGGGVESGEIKDAVTSAITAAKASINKLGGEDVKGVSSIAVPETTPSSTPQSWLTVPPVSSSPRAKANTTLEAGILIDEVITIGEDRESTPVGK